MDSAFSTKAKWAFGIVLIAKLVLLALFSSGYQDELFIPFVMQFLSDGGNPWANPNAHADAFPYPPLMLYLVAGPLSIASDLNGPSWLTNLFYGLPILFSDLLITYLLIKMFIWNKTEIFAFYFASPIVLFSSYMHGQLDLVPTAILFASIYLLANRQFLFAAFVAGMAISTKFHTIAALPLMAIYCVNKGDYKQAGAILTIPLLIFALMVAPYSENSAFFDMVLRNPKQQLLFSSYFEVGQFKIFLPLLLAMVIYIRFAAYRKINIDLLYAACGALFYIFLLLIEPSPGWFIWMAPYLTIFFIRYFDGIQHYLMYGAMCTLYLTFYLLFYDYDFVALKWLGEEVDLGYDNPLLPLDNIVYTVLQAVLMAVIYQFYKNGIKSNDIYTMEQAFVIGIGGDSGAGKTTLISYLKAFLNNDLLQLEGDSDHKWERGHDSWQQYTHLNPKANALHFQAQQVANLKQRKSIQRSDYDHSTGTFTDTDRIQAKDFIVLAGLHPFYLPKMRKVIDLKIFLDLDERLRRSWKIERDKTYRGYSEEQVLESLSKREEDSKRFIHPQKKFSDLTISLFPSDESQFQGHTYHGPLGLNIEMNANIPLDSVIDALSNTGCQITWDYSEDLTTQYIRFDREPETLDIGWFVSTYVTNWRELVNQPNWLPGYAGITQFLILFAMSEIMQDRALKHV